MKVKPFDEHVRYNMEDEHERGKQTLLNMYGLSRHLYDHQSSMVVKL